MAVTLMTTTGTQENVNAALGLPLESVAAPAQSPMAPQTVGKVEEMPAKAAPVVETPAETPAPVAAAPVEPVLEPEGEPELPIEGLTPQQQGAHTRNRLQKRINELVATRYKTEGQLVSAHAEIDRLRSQLGVAATPPGEPSIAHPAPTAPVTATPPTTLARPKPKSDDTNVDGSPKYATYEDFIEDLSDFKAEQRVATSLAAQQDAQARQREQEQVQAAVTEIQKHIETFRGTHPDYDDVVNNPEVKINDAMMMVLRDPANTLSPAMAYYLGQHPDECKRIAALPPFSAAAEMGAIKAQLTPGNGKPAAPAAPIPKAPTPPTTVRSAAAITSQSLDDLAKTVTPGSHTTSEWIARRNAEVAQRGRR